MRTIRSRAALSVAAVWGALGSGVALASSATLYSGATNQVDPARHSLQLNFYLYVVGNRVSEVEYYANYTGDNALCATRFDVSLTRIFPRAQIRDGRFLSRRIDNGSRLDVVQDLQGRFRGRTVTGSFTESFRTYDRSIHRSIHCTSGKIEFRAVRQR